jgi:hypothetical protein
VTTVSFDSSLLVNYYQARLSQSVAGLTNATTGSSSTKAVGANAAGNVPSAPWNSSAAPATTSALVNAALAGTHKLIDPDAAQLDVAGASSDYKNMFALYSGLNTLSALATQAAAGGNSATQLAALQKAFATGLATVQSFVSSTKLTNLRLADGTVTTDQSAATARPADDYTYTAPAIVTGSRDDPAPAFEGDVRFNITVSTDDETSSPIDIPIDLSEMGSTPRSLPDVVNFINGKLDEAGVDTRFSTYQIPTTPQTVTTGSTTTTVTPPDQWTWQIKGNSVEQVSFSAPETATAVYMTQLAGHPNATTTSIDKTGTVTTTPAATSQQFLKFQTDDSGSSGAPPTALTQPGATFAVDGEAFAQTLGSEVGAVHASVTGPDGSVYILADVTGATEGQSIAGSQDVALMKYNSAGQLQFSRTLGAAATATGLGLAVSADGQVAVAGSVTGVLSGATEGPSNSDGPSSTATASDSDSFVTLYDADGNEVWTQRRGARDEDEASQVAFGDDGTVYVAGRAKSAMPGADAAEDGGGWDGYVEAFKADDAGAVQTVFTQSFGSTGTDTPKGLVVDGNSVVVASVEDGHGVLRRYDVSGDAPVLSATRDLGDLAGGDIVGLALDNGKLVVGGTSGDGALDAGTITRSASGGSDAFAATLSADLSSSASDSVAYYGGSGEDKATAMAVSNGQVWLAGTTNGDLPDQPAVGNADGFLTELDVSSGSVDWSRRFTAQGGAAAPSTLAVSSSGASVLDRLGLPSGDLDLTNSDRLTAWSSVRAGETFTIKSGSGAAGTVTIEDTDTLSSLALKIQRASGFQATVTTTTVDGLKQLKITPTNSRTTVELGSGKAGSDALGALGLTAGLIRETVTTKGVTKPADGKATVYGLNLNSGLNLTTADAAKVASKAISDAMTTLRNAYKDLTTPATTTTSSTSSSTVPSYITDQISNYQLALARLQANSTTTTDDSSSTDITSLLLST